MTFTKAHDFIRKGYQFHSDTADGENPIRCILTSASVHDSQGMLPLAVMTQQRYRLRPRCSAYTPLLVSRVHELSKIAGYRA